MERFAGRVIILWGWRRWLVATLAGAVASLALAPVDFPAAGFLAFPILVWLLDGAVISRGLFARALPFFATGWWFGFGYFLAGMGWVGVPFATFEGAPAFLLVTIGLPAGLALFYGFAAIVARFLWSDGLGRIAGLAFGFGLAEWLRMVVLSGFSWNAIGYAIMPLPVFMQAVQIVGLIGMSAAAVFVFAAPALIGTRRHMVPGLALMAILVVAQLGYGYFRLAAPPAKENAIQVRLVQPGGGKDSFEDRFQDYLDLSASPATGPAPPDLILWPEEAIPFVLTERPDLLSELGRTVGEKQVLVTGTKRRDVTGDKALHNAVAVIAERGEIADAADKQARIPFAGNAYFVQAARALDLPALLAAEPGPYEGSRRLLRIAEGVQALPLIGDEAVIPGLGSREGKKANLLLNPADYTAFAGTPAPYQHLRQAQIRAVEAVRPLLIAMPQGISAVIDARGKILGALRPGDSGIIDVSLSGAKETIVSTENYMYDGLTFAAFFGILALLLSVREPLM